ncbi:MAG: hypothetical protein U1E76_03870 [Planctomycetota bacterium]
MVYSGTGTCPDPNMCGVYHHSSLDGQSWSNAAFVPGSEDIGFWSDPSVVGAPGGRAYIIWFGSKGLEITWTDDLGHSFAPVVAPAPSAPGGYQVSAAVDRIGNLHMVWAAYDLNLYYLRSFQGLAPPLIARDPVFLPVQRLSAEDGKFNATAFVGVDDAGYVAIAYVTVPPRTIACTRAYQGLNFPPSVSLGSADRIQLAVFADGAVTILLDATGGNQEKIWSLVAMDGEHFEGPFQVSENKGGLMNKREVCAGRNGALYAILGEEWQGMGILYHLTYRESHDHGRTFPRRELVWDNNQYPGAAEQSLAVTPDGWRCMVEQVVRYTQSR